MLQLQALGQIANRRWARMRFHGQQKLVLCRFETGASRGFFAKAQKPANLVAKLGQRLKIGRSQILRFFALNIYRNTICLARLPYAARKSS